MIENREMAEFARNLWENYIKFRNKEAAESNVSFYKAKVTANPGNGTLTIQRPFDSQTLSVQCPDYMSSATVGTNVLVLRFGEGNNLANHFVIDNAARTMMASAISSGGGGSTVQVTQTLTSGTEIGRISVNGTETILYAPAYTNANNISY